MVSDRRVIGISFYLSPVLRNSRCRPLKPISGNRHDILFASLHFLDGLRNRFIKNLNLKEGEYIVPKESHYYVAIGAALLAKDEKYVQLDDIIEKISAIKVENDADGHIEPLFIDNDDYEEFKIRHEQDKVKREELESYKGNAFLGIDAGSTTTKLVLIDRDGNLLYSLYGNNEGNPLQSVISMLKQLYLVLPEMAIIGYMGISGYG